MRPIPSLADSVLEVGNIFGQVLCLLIFMMIVFTQGKLKGQTNDIVFGYPMLVILFVTLVTNIVYGMVSGVIGVV